MGLLAYAARYGHQPLSELRALPMWELKSFCREIEAIIGREGHHRED